MADDRIQNYGNHRAVDPVFYALGLFWLGAVGAGAAGVLQGEVYASLACIVLAIGVLVLWLRVRVYATRVQDRIIRLEMRLRLERVLPSELVARIPELSLSQLIGLRFESDANLPGLARKVLDEKITTANEIKRQVKDWQADWLRV